MKKICSYCCSVVIDAREKSCAKCIDRIKKYKRSYNNNRQDIVDIYNSKEWKLCKEKVKYNLLGLDLVDYFLNNKITYADVYHHIIEVSEDKNKAFDVSNVIGLSDSNHKRVHSAYNKGMREKRKTQELLIDLLQRWRYEVKMRDSEE